MIVLDTNVLSEVMKPSPSRQVLRWLAGHPPLLVFTTTITQAYHHLHRALRYNAYQRKRRKLWGR